MNCDRSFLKYTAFRSGIGEDDQPIGRCDGPAPERIARSSRIGADRAALAPQPPFWRDASTPISAWSTSEAPAMVATAIGNPWIAALCKGLERSACVSDIHRSPGVHCVGHDDQPAPILVDTVANGPKNVSIRPVAKLPGRSEVGGHKQSDRHWKILGEVETAGERAGS